MLAFGVCASAHHAFESEFDAMRPIHLEGRITKIEWTNPHVYVDIDVGNAAGAVSHLRLELISPNNLFRAGWTPKTLQPKMDIAADGFSSKTPSSHNRHSQHHNKIDRPGLHSSAGLLASPFPSRCDTPQRVTSAAT
jgi:hypothetical protein